MTHGFVAPGRTWAGSIIGMRVLGVDACARGWGGFALTKAKLRGGEQWLLVKKDDEGADRRRKLPVRLFGASTGAATALVAAADDHSIRAVVSRGGRPDLADGWFHQHVPV